MNPRRVLVLSLVLVCALLCGCASNDVKCEIAPLGPIAKEGHVLLYWTTLAPGQKPPCGKRGCTTCINGVCNVVLVEAPELADVCHAARFSHELGHAMGGKHAE